MDKTIGDILGIVKSIECVCVHALVYPLQILYDYGIHLEQEVKNGKRVCVCVLVYIRPGLRNSGVCGFLFAEEHLKRSSGLDWTGPGEA